jgi:molybdopterin/thiamine biosynthesis adenylyltransferase
MYSLIRHMHIFNPVEHENPVLLVGCGAVGSHIAMQLLAMGCETLTVVDFDRVESHNLANQIFNHDDVGAYKVDALIGHAARKLGDAPILCPLVGKLPELLVNCPTASQARQARKTPVLILAVDSMAARREIAEAVVATAIRRNQNWHIIETRMASTHGNVYSFPYSNAFLDKYESWKRTLISDDEGEVSPCGTPMVVIPTVQVISSLAVWEYIKLCVDPDAMSEVTDVFLKPTMISTRDL